ncbi:Sodium-dependent serotonin transporter [Echinococcus granulosus]|uniref:Transporter n=1 Tax=Echinococcus granulosus TaxID=6210 RepID=W6UF91_ECHGR|nr:Sodium-dependent serotonin transporter [Echinococcus granulosus]EUB59773.1 Sodium-dependent serotonin transporter [Echinococcus granulosus]
MQQITIDGAKIKSEVLESGRNAVDVVVEDKSLKSCNLQDPTPSLVEAVVVETAEAGVTKVERKREKWDTKVDFLLSVIGFAVDLGNIWRFPYICYQNGGGAFLIPYLLMYIFGGLPLFYLELALGQFQRSGCISVWSRICPFFTGLGYGICIIASYTAWYYNTVISWALFYMFDSMRLRLPWDSCDNWWNTPKTCITVYQKLVTGANSSGIADSDASNTLHAVNTTGYYSSTEQYFYNRVLQIQFSDGFNKLGTIRWEVALCLLAVFTLVYFALWKGVKSSGKAVWITATLPYVILFILLIRGLTLRGSLMGIQYYLLPDFGRLKSIEVWNAAASQIFFSLGPGFGVLLALASYNRFRNNCYYDAMLTSAINCGTSFLSGFVVFSVLGHMCYRMNRTMDTVANEGPSLVFIAYPEAIATLPGSTFWAIIFMLMLITLGLDSTFGGLEAIITALLDRWPKLRKRREIVVLIMIIYCYVGALPTTTNGGYYILTLFDTYGAPFSILFIVFCECVALCWCYGVGRFTRDIESMLGFKPGWFWRICWAVISPAFMLGIFILNITFFRPPEITVMGKTVRADTWVHVVSWMLVFSSLVTIPIFAVVTFCNARGSFKERLKSLFTPGIRPSFSDFHVHPNSHKKQEIKDKNEEQVAKSAEAVDDTQSEGDEG